MLKNVIRLSRFEDYYHTVILATVAGMLLSGTYTLHVVPLILANMFYMAFSFAFNNSQDYKEDRKDKKKSNVVSRGRIKYSDAVIVSFIFLLLSVSFIVMTKIELIFIYAPAILLSFLYSWRKVRLKTKPMIDVFIHGFAFGGIFVLSGYLLSGSLDEISTAFFLAAFFASASVEILNEIRDFNGDKSQSFRTTAIVLGKKNARAAFLVFLSLSAVFTLYAFFMLLEFKRFFIWTLLALPMTLYIFLSLKKYNDIAKDILQVFNTLKLSYIPFVFGLFIYTL